MFAILLLSCNKKSKYSNIPKITFNSLTPNQITAGQIDSAISIFIAVEDGDGNIGFNAGNLYFKDLRDTITTSLPFLK
ncbi:MAG: hypothetical protein R2831_12675 [Chitinophagaceae bacterium]